MSIEPIEHFENEDDHIENSVSMEKKDIFFETRKSGFKPFQKICDDGLLKAGTRFDGKCVEKIFEMKYVSGDWKFLEKYIVLKNLIESEGYFCTQKDIAAPGFRILDSNEMCDYAKKKLLKNTISTFKIGYVLAAHDNKDALTEEERKKLLNMQKAAARMALNSQADLLKSFSV